MWPHEFINATQPRLRRRRSAFVAVLLSGVIFVAASTAQSSFSIADAKRWTLAELFARAWANHPMAALTDAIGAEEKAKNARADSWLAAPPKLDSSVRTDALTTASRRDGLREIEFEIAAPIATAGRRQLQAATVDAEAQAKRAELDVARLKLAGEVREAFWAAKWAERDLQLADDEARRARTLAEDSARRTRAGESARVDTLQAESAAQLAASGGAQARGKYDAALAQLAQLIGHARNDAASASVTALAESRESKPELPRVDTFSAHVALAHAERLRAIANAKLKEASRLASEPPTAKFAIANERTDQGGSRNTARLGVSIPLDAAFRFGRFNEARVAQATRELAEADASRAMIVRMLAGELRAAELALATAEVRAPLAQRRAELATEFALLYEKAYRLGELDLPTRLRIEGERSNAVRDAARAELDLLHAISRLQQALGNLP